MATKERERRHKMSKIFTGHDGELVAGSMDEYAESMRLLSDYNLAIEIQSNIPTKDQHAIAVTEYNRRIQSK